MCMEYIVLALGAAFVAGMSILILVRARQLRAIPRNTNALVRRVDASFRHLTSTLKHIAGKV